MKGYDCLIVGGGASGLMAAISAKRAAPKLRVALFERGARVGRKLLTTGNGRCNLSNADLVLSRYHGGDLDAAERVLARFDGTATAAFFASLGIPLRQEGGEGKLYPYSLQAGSVVDALRFECDRLGVETVLERRVTALIERGVAFEGGEATTSAVVVACGGRAAPHTGSDGAGCDLLRSAGHSVTRLFPAIVPLRTETEPIRPVAKLRIEGVVTATAGGEMRREAGEIHFADYGLSGPPVLQLSGFVAAHGGADLTLDLLPDRSEEWLFGWLSERRAAAYGDRAENLLLGLFHKRIGLMLLKRCGLSASAAASALPDSTLAALARAAKAFPLRASGTASWADAQVTAGGVPLREFDNTLMSRRRAGLFACGEVLDVTGDCGGFNLQWAWSSGFVAGTGAAAFAEAAR